MPSIREKLAGKTSKLATPRERISDHPADSSGYQEGAFCTVEVALIMPDPDQPRKYFDPESLEELSQSIKQRGVLQPVIIRKQSGGEIFLVAGERRFRAARMAGLEKIPAILTRGNPMEIALIENLQREDLRPIEEAEALARMVEDHGYTHEQLAYAVGKARSTISEALSLNRLPEEIREECRRADLYPRRLLVEVAKQESAGAMRALFKKIKNRGLKSGQVREITRKVPEKDRTSPASVALKHISALMGCLPGLDLSSLEKDEAAQVLAELKKLRRMIGKILR
ncbi:MAG: ParB/RepB/Spo0J family partition protein [Syntrophobacteraceae bacterium]